MKDHYMDKVSNINERFPKTPALVWAPPPPAPAPNPPSEHYQMFPGIFLGKKPEVPAAEFRCAQCGYFNVAKKFEIHPPHGKKYGICKECWTSDYQDQYKQRMIESCNEFNQ